MTDAQLAHLGPDETRASFDEIQAIYAEAFPAYDLEEHRARTLRQAASPAFDTVIARVDGVLVGFVYGMPLSPQTAWWKGLSPDPGDGFTTETGDRTFAVIDLAVSPAHQGHGIGKALVDELLRPRTQERATLATDPKEPEIQRMYERWGWSKIGRVPGGPGETEPEFDLYVIALREESDSSS